MKHKNRVFNFIVSLLLFLAVAQAQTKNSYPMLMSVKPTAAQIGQATECEISARYNLAGADRLIVSGTGVTGEIVPDPMAKPEDSAKHDVMASKLKVRFTIAADVVPGVRDFRIITPHGASTVGQIVLTRDPIVSEVVDNDLPGKAQEIPLPATVCGAIEKAEDVDYYKFHVEAGTALTFHVRAQRLLNRLHDMQIREDPMISVKTESGATLAASDNYYAGDPLLHYRFDTAGIYLLEIRDVRYQGNVDWVYAIEINSRPFVTQAYPLAATVGVATTFALIGFNLPSDATTSLTLPAEGEPGLRWISPLVGGQPANEFAVFVTHLPIVPEPTPQPPPPTTPPTATATLPLAVPIPAVLVGSISQPGEVDRFLFEAQAQEKVCIEVFARRAWSGIDPIIRILNEAGAPQVENDDGNFDRVNSADSYLESWTAPAAGKYWIEITDLHQRGGPEFPYAIQVTRPAPHFLLQADTDKTLLAPGMSSVIYVRGIRRQGFTGEIKLGVEGLPPGVTAIAGKVLPDSPDGCIILQAAPEAAMGAANIQIFGTGSYTPAMPPNSPPVALKEVAHILQEYYSPGGGRGNSPVDLHTVSVEQPMDIRSIKVSTTEVELKPGGSQKIEVTIERAPDYTGNVTLDLILQHLESPFGNSLPKGVKVDVGASKTLLTNGETQGHITLIAAAEAPVVERQLVPVNVHVSINFVMKHTWCGSPLFVSVKK